MITNTITQLKKNWILISVCLFAIAISLINVENNLIQGLLETIILALLTYLGIRIANYLSLQKDVDEIINDVANWQRQLTNIGGEPGYFYFKIFFKFKTNYGLLADLLKEQSNQKQLSQGSAIFYLASIEHRYKHEQIPHRMLALYKFGSTLRALQTETLEVLALKMMFVAIVMSALSST